MTIIWKKEKFERTSSGKGFSTKPVETSFKTIDERTYWNLAGADSLRFWNGFMGGTCRAQKTYTPLGYTPYRITRVNPARDEKHVDTFSFTD